MNERFKYSFRLLILINKLTSENRTYLSFNNNLLGLGNLINYYTKENLLLYKVFASEKYMFSVLIDESSTIDLAVFK